MRSPRRLAVGLRGGDAAAPRTDASTGPGRSPTDRDASGPASPSGSVPARPAGARGPVAPGALAVLVGGVLAVSTAATLIRLSVAEPPAIAAYRMLFATLLLLPFSARRLPTEIRRLSPSDRAWLALAGLFLALHFALWIASLFHTSVASSVALVTTTPLWVALSAPLLIGQRVTRALGSGILLAFAGAVLIGAGDLHASRHAVAGDLMALGGALAAAAYFLIGSRIRPHLHLATYVTAVYGSAAIALVLGCLALGVPMTGYSSSTWLALFLLGAVPQVLGHSSFNWALRRLSATFVSGAVLGEAIGGALLAWWVLGEAPPGSAVAGGGLVLSGLALAARGETAAASGPRPAEGAGQRVG